MTRAHDCFGNGDLSSIDLAAAGRLNSLATELHIKWRYYRGSLTRIEEMQIEIVEELLVNAMIIKGFDKAANTPQIMAQIYHWAWTRTFADRLAEMVLRFGDSTDATRESIEHDLNEAWRTIEGIIAMIEVILEHRHNETIRASLNPVTLEVTFPDMPVTGKMWPVSPARQYVEITERDGKYYSEPAA